MVRRKQIQPRHAAGIVEVTGEVVRESNARSASTSQQYHRPEDFVHSYIEVKRINWNVHEHLDISEIVLRDVIVDQGFYDFLLDEDFYQDIRYCFRIRVTSVNRHQGRTRLCHWPKIPASNVILELIDMEFQNILISGAFDGTDEGISGLVHLISLNFLTLRPFFEGNLLKGISSLRVRVEILSEIFNACGSLLDNNRQVWKKSMMDFMAWVRPEVTCSETRYGFIKSPDMQANSNNLHKERIPIADFYEGIKPSKAEPMLDDEIPDLLLELRPYQRHAVHWMIQRENGSPGIFEELENVSSPFCVSLELIGSSSTIFYNPFNGNVSPHPDFLSKVFGGILADEMGLGKTVELLSCIFCHRKPQSSVSDYNFVTRDLMASFKRIKKERVECMCGSTFDSPKYTGLWVQCDICDAWQHADCVGYVQLSERKSTVKFQKRKHNIEKSSVISDDDEFICQACLKLMEVSHPPIPSGATLIVCPAPILAQWFTEITRHTKPGSLNVYIYEGVKNTSLPSQLDLNALVKFDIVLTTYDVLRYDLWRDFDRHQGDFRFMRFGKRYPVYPTPLTRILWWRVCLDEAQMVESNVASATEMAMRLPSEHRWCISGTPVQRKFEDLFGLLKFIRASPFDVPKWWNDIIRCPYETRDEGAINFTHKFFKKIMWRTSKIHVLDELQLPPQEEHVSYLRLSPVEEHFYQKQHETWVMHAHDFIGHFSHFPPDVINQPECAKLLNSLLKLRQACCHPQVGNGGLRSLQHAPMTMEEILEVLIAKAKTEGEEALRRLAVALNGLAAVAIINQDFANAVSLYKEALNFAAEHSADFCLDPLLNLHIHHNLGEILPVPPACMHSSSTNESTNVECLRVCRSIEQKYLNGFTSKLSLARNEFEQLHMQVHATIKDGKETIWWLEALHEIEQNNDSCKELIKKITYAVLEHINSPILPSRLRNISSIKYTLQTNLDFLLGSRQKLVHRLLEIDQSMGDPREEDVVRVRYCPKCNQEGDGPLCHLCELDGLFRVYEAKLFRANTKDGLMLALSDESSHLQNPKPEQNRFFSQKIESIAGKREAGESVVIAKLPSVMEMILGIIKSYWKGKLSKEGKDSAVKQLKLLEDMRKEFSLARALAVTQAQVLRAYDEILMAKSRLRLAANRDDRSIGVINVEQSVVANVEYSNEKFIALSLLQRIKGQLRYLKGLTKQNTLFSGCSSENACPICQEKITDQKMVFQCGHFTCCKCLIALTERRLLSAGGDREKWVMCPTCRERTELGNIACAVNEGGKTSKCSEGMLRCYENSEALVNVRGSYSTKIEAVTRRILCITGAEPEAKILVFSTWNDVLDVLEHALTVNGVNHVRMAGGRKSDITLRRFRELGSGAVLLLLFRHGANGLNLLEARHVIIVEPLLNPAVEAQAISRVHRIGQDKSTMVHRFIVKDTVEESVYKLNSGKSSRTFCIAGVIGKNEDESDLSLKDVESLLAAVPPMASVKNEESRGNLMYLPPAVAAVEAAKRRLEKNTATSTQL